MIAIACVKQGFGWQNFRPIQRKCEIKEVQVLPENRRTNCWRRSFAIVVASLRIVEG